MAFGFVPIVKLREMLYDKKKKNYVSFVKSIASKAENPER